MFPYQTKILVADDTTMMRRMIKDLLFGLEYKNVICCADGVEAWKELENSLAEPYGLIISDWNMPRLSGLDLLKKVRSTDFCQKMPFIMLTAETEKERVVEALQAGVSNYITKPFTSDTIKAKLKIVYDKIYPQKAG